ncbi:MAG: dTMP kinase [Candidatus Phytoplasma sp.]|nr:dTMP kinase [Phytoplasma sp.]
MFITFEGGEGTGKTTIISKLQTYFQQKNYDVVITREPGGSKIPEQIRKVILDPKNTEITSATEALLYAAARAQHLDEIIIPAIKADKLILCDRYIDSSFAYQGYARNLGVEFVEKINTYAMQYLPNLTFYIDLDPNIGQERLKKNRSHKIDRLDAESCSFHDKVRAGYLEIANQYANRFVVINGNQTVEAIYEEILNRINEIL